MSQVVVVDESFPITGRGFIVILQHFQQGLSEGTVLKSESTGQSWKVKSRIMFTHLVEKHRFFESELINYMTLSGANLEKREESDTSLLKKEQNHIFQYLLQGITHEQKPKVGESLVID